MPDTDSELAKIAERLGTLVETNRETKQTANDALNSSNTAKSDVLVEATRIDGQIALLCNDIQAQTDRIEDQANRIRAEVWKNLYTSVWKPIALVAVIVGLLSADANGLTTWLISNAAPQSAQHSNARSNGDRALESATC